MDPQRSAQDVLLCDSCKTTLLQSHCELCQINLCANCVGKHILDSSKRHNVVHYKHKKSTINYPECPKHADKHCEFFGENCDVPVCSTCVTSGKHKGHDISDILQKLGYKTEGLQKDLEELETRSYPRYEETVSPPVKPMQSPEAVSSPPVKSLLDEPRLTAIIDTGYNIGCVYLLSVSCLGEEQFWVCGGNKIMKLLNHKGKLLTSIQTKSGNVPLDISVTREGDLVYTDYENKTVNLLKNKQIQTVITLQGWRPRNVCITSSDDILVAMISDDRKQSKVVCYTDYTEKQTIQFDDQGHPLYSSGDTKYISENRNLDICVADNTVSAVVVVNQSGKIRFRYTGHPSNTKVSFNPRGITTDSQSHILTADWENDRIHILNQDGQFLRYIQNLRRPWGLCVDIRDNLFVAECNTAKVKEIQYLSTEC